MQAFHDKTDINAKKYLTDSSFIDYRTQPKSFKKYPDFFLRFKIDEIEELKFLSYIGKITDTKTYVKNSVDLRANPSAGGLYPSELYIQIRGVKSLVSGIYHYEPLENQLCLIHELSNDGVENYFDETSQQKFIFLISNAYFRSSWKYEDRAIRYILLDTGHLLGSIYAALKLANIPYEINFNFDKYSLNEEFGFDNYESFYVSVTTGEYKEIEPKKLRSPIVSVPSCDYQIKNPFVEEFYNTVRKDNFEKLTNINFLDDLSNDRLLNAIEKRRSVRAFRGESISKDAYEFITKNIFDFAVKYNIDIYIVNNNIEDMKKGLYKNVNLLKTEDFSQVVTNLALNQKLAGTSAFTLIFSSNDEKNYFYLYTLCGFISQILYLRATALNLSISGIGAYFDDITKEFLDTSNNIFYFLSIGK